MNSSNIPPCTAVGPGGTRIVVHPWSAADSVAELARALDLPPSTGLVIDGHVVGPHERLVDTRLRIGSEVSAGRVDEPSSIAAWSADGTTCADLDGSVQVAVVAGPACTPWFTLGCGRHVIGRARTADVRIDDPDTELHHGALDVSVDGLVTFTQFTGRVPVSIDGRPCAGPCAIRPGQTMLIGASRLGVRAVADAPQRCAAIAARRGSLVVSDRDPWRRVVRRAPAATHAADVAELTVPEPPASHRGPPMTGLIGAGVAAAGAGMMAVLLGQVLFALFAMIGAVTAVATWGVGAGLAWRDRRRAVAAHEQDRSQFRRLLARAREQAERAHRSENRTLADALGTATGDGASMWSSRRADGPMRTTIGTGTVRWSPPIGRDDRERLDAELLVAIDDCERIDDAPVPLEIVPGQVVSMRGDDGAVSSLCRAIIVQLAVGYGPADWELMVVSANPRRWAWSRWLPHGSGDPTVIDAADDRALVAAMERPSDVPIVLVLDAPALLAARTGPLRRRLARGDVACIVLLTVDESVPAVTDLTLELGATGRACRTSWASDTSGSEVETASAVQLAGVSTERAEVVARRLSSLIDPECHDGQGAVPRSVSLADLGDRRDRTAVAIARRWQAAGPDPSPVARLGLSADGAVEVDLVRDGPHGLIAGTTGSGKSELLRTLVASLATNVSPDHLNLVLIDFKGGSTFDVLARLPHTVGVVTDLDDGLAQRVLVSLDAEIRRRERLIRDAGADDLTDYRRLDLAPLPRLVVVIDEFAILAKELPDVMAALVAVAQRGRSLGVHLLLATQRPAGVVTDDIRANTNLRLALRVHDSADASDVVGDVTPAGFPSNTPGRAALRLGPDDLVVFQAATCSGPAPPPAGRLRVDWPERPVGPIESCDDSPSALAELVAAVGEASAMTATGPVRRPWIDPLPDVVRPRDLPTGDGVVGWIDDPARQMRRALQWLPSDGNLLLVGSVGTGTTTTARTVTVASLAAAGGGRRHVYVIDGQGDAAWDGIVDVPQCAGVVRLGETERFGRLLRRLDGEMDRRGVDGTRTPSIVVVVDGVPAVRSALGDVAMAEASAQFERLLRDGPALGIVSCLTTEGSSASALTVSRSATWVFRVENADVARATGLRTAPVVVTTPGRLRVVENGLEAQVAFDDEGPFSVPSGVEVCLERPAGLGVLPAEIDADELDRRVPSGCVGVDACDERPLELLMGVAADDLGPAMLRVPIGDHVFVGGGARTGRSTALRQVESSWRGRHPAGVVVVVDRHHPLTTTSLAIADDLVRPVLVVVDDAERVDDPNGHLARLVAQRRRGLTVAVAARLESVRVAYGHWSREVTRSRCGLIMTAATEVDGELLGVTLPRRPLIAARPGLAWLVDDRGHHLAQVAARMPP